MRFDKVYFFYPHLRLLAAIILACLAFYFQAALAVADDTTIERADVHAEAHVTTPPTSLSWAAAAIITPTQIADYLANPGIGWQEAQTPHNPILPETTAYRRPQYSWRDQNPAENIFDWSRVDADLQAAANSGKLFSFRLYTMRGGSLGGHQVPQWVLNKGAVILPNGEPDYSNCVYQAEWSKFVEAMRQKYDGNTHIAFIDISGYGSFNEWSWQDQTNTEESSLDAQARRRLADMFIGGAGTIQCRIADGQIQVVAYDYPGFQSTQLVMPYAGIAPSTRYVAGRRADIGFRHDCLGSASHTNSMMSRVGDVILNTWRKAPIVYEFCAGSTADPNFMAQAANILRLTHGSIVHDNLAGQRSAPVLATLLKFAGYRFALLQFNHPRFIESGDAFNLSMVWANIGYAPAYPKMGQDFELHFYLMHSGAVVRDWLINTDIATWMPADPIPGVPPPQVFNLTFQFPASSHSKIYQTKIAIINKRTGQGINLPLLGRDPAGRYTIGAMIVPGPNIKSSFLPLVLK